MKKSLFMLALSVGLLTACGKEKVQPTATSQGELIIDIPESNEKELAKTKRMDYCETRNRSHELLANGLTCRSTGDECGRKDRCSTGLYPTQDPNEVIFEGMTRREFNDMWNTDEGMEYLISKGVYVVTAE